MSTENIAHYFYGSPPTEDELMNAVFNGENTVDTLKTAANQHKFLYIEKIRLWNELHMALVGCLGTEPISHEPLSQAIVGVDFVDDGQVSYDFPPPSALVPPPFSFSQADHILAKSGQMPFLKMLKEETENELHLVIFGAVVEENTDSGDSCGNPIIDTILAQCKPIVSDSSNRKNILI